MFRELAIHIEMLKQLTGGQIIAVCDHVSVSRWFCVSMSLCFLVSSLWGLPNALLSHVNPSVHLYVAHVVPQYSSGKSNNNA